MRSKENITKIIANRAKINSKIVRLFRFLITGKNDFLSWLAFFKESETLSNAIKPKVTEARKNTIKGESLGFIIPWPQKNGCVKNNNITKKKPGSETKPLHRTNKIQSPNRNTTK